MSVISITDGVSFTIFGRRSSYRDDSSIMPLPVIPVALPQTPRFSRHRGSSEISAINKKGEPEDSPDDDISSSPIRLSLGELLLSRARFRFTGPLFPWWAWNVFISSGACLTWQARIKLQEEFFIKLSLLLFGPNGQEFSCHGIEQS